MTYPLLTKFVDYINSDSLKEGTVIKYGKYSIKHCAVSYYETTGMSDAAFAEFVNDVKLSFKHGAIHEIRNEVITEDYHINYAFAILIKQAGGKHPAMIYSNCVDCIIEMESAFGLPTRHYQGCLFSHGGVLYTLEADGFVEHK